MGEPGSEDRRLSERFDELRNQEQLATPTFGTTWASAAARAERQSRRKPVLIGALGLATAAAALWLALAPSEPDELTAPVFVLVHDPEPLAFLRKPMVVYGIDSHPSFNARPFRYQLEEVLEGSQDGATP